MNAQEKFSVGIIGTGPIGLGTAALLEKNGVKTRIWSPLGGFKPVGDVRVSGAVEHGFTPEMALSAQDLVAKSDVIFVAVPAYGHRYVLEQIARFMCNGQSVIISSHVPFASEFLRTKLATREVDALIIALSTTIVSGRKSGAQEVTIGTLRGQVDMAALPANRATEALTLCRQLFGDRFVLRDNLLTIALSNLNPQNHLGIALCNMTRIEKGEAWIQAENITPAVGRLLEKLDAERLAIAKAFDLTTRDIFEHFSRSFHVPMGSVSEMSAAMVANGHIGHGPTSAETRYVLEDVPYGLVPIAWLGQCAGVPAKLHEAGINLFNALYGRDFYAENELMRDLGSKNRSDADLLELLAGHDEAGMVEQAKSGEKLH